MLIRVNFMLCSVTEDKNCIFRFRSRVGKIYYPKVNLGFLDQRGLRFAIHRFDLRRIRESRTLGAKRCNHIQTYNCGGFMEMGKTETES